MTSDLSQERLGIIAGEGQFPFLVARGARKKNMQVFAAGFEGHTDPSLVHEVHELIWLKLGQLNRLITFFASNSARTIVFAGAINKPRALSIRPDLRVVRMLWGLKSKNDTALLKGVAGEMESEGLTIVSALEYAPELNVKAGNLTRRKPGKKELKDIAWGWSMAKELGKLDIGQCLVVHDQMVVAVEAMEGTNGAILRAGELLRGKGGVVIKIFKPGQSEFIDQPSVGLETIETMRRAGMSCLVVEAGRSLFFDRERSIELADRSGISIVGLDEEEGFTQDT